MKLLLAILFMDTRFYSKLFFIIKYEYSCTYMSVIIKLFRKNFIMNINLELLYKIAKKPSRLIIDLMSGTSMNGLDVALCEVSGAAENTKITQIHFKTVEYSDAIKTEIQKVFAKQNIDFHNLVLLNE